MSDELRPDPLASLLRSALPPHDLADARIAAMRTAARAELRDAVRPYRRLRRAFETTATFAFGASQLMWMINMLWGTR